MINKKDLILIMILLFLSTILEHKYFPNFAKFDDLLGCSIILYLFYTKKWKDFF